MKCSHYLWSFLESSCFMVFLLYSLFWPFHRSVRDQLNKHSTVSGKGQRIKETVIHSPDEPSSAVDESRSAHDPWHLIVNTLIWNQLSWSFGITQAVPGSERKATIWVWHLQWSHPNTTTQLVHTLCENVQAFMASGLYRTLKALNFLIFYFTITSDLHTLLLQS